MSESVNEELNRIKSNIVNTYSTLSDVGLISEGDTNSDNLANTVKNLSWGGGELCDIGLALFIDESAGMRRLLNGQILNIESKYKPFLNKLQLIAITYPNILCTETEWQAIKEGSPFGQVGKFVLNYDEAGENVVSVRLPAVVNLQGLQDLQYLGDKLDEALPNITGFFASWWSNLNAPSGAFYGTNPTQNASSAGGNKDTQYYDGMNFDASRSSSIYKNNAHVQQEAIQYPYYIQVNLTEYNHMIDVGLVNDLNDRINVLENKVYLVEAYNEGNNWYRIYSDGWCEQGGKNTFSGTTEIIYSFIKEYKDTNYFIQATSIEHTHPTYAAPRSTSQFKIGKAVPNVAWGSGEFYWEAKGYIEL